jgi:hypothetical protein
MAYDGFGMDIAPSRHQPLSPVVVELTAPVLCRATVNAPDLEDYFGQRVSVHSANDGRRIVAFLPALGVEDIWAIVKLSHSFHRKRLAQMREPLALTNRESMFPFPIQKYTIN